MATKKKSKVESLVRRSQESIAMHKNNVASDEAWQKEQATKNKAKNIKSYGKPKQESVKKFVPVKNPMPFDLEEARNGTPLVFRDRSQSVKFVGFTTDVEKGLVVSFLGSEYDDNGKLQKVGEIGERYPNGQKNLDSTNSKDILLNVESEEKWVTLHPLGEYNVHDSKEQAMHYSYDNLLVPAFKIFVRK